MLLDDSVRWPHTLISEDRVQYKHNGYVEKSCVSCGKMFIVGIEGCAKISTCGRDLCDHGAAKGAA